MRLFEESDEERRQNELKRQIDHAFTTSLFLVLLCGLTLYYALYQIKARLDSIEIEIRAGATETRQRITEDIRQEFERKDAKQ